MQAPVLVFASLLLGLFAPSAEAIRNNIIDNSRTGVVTVWTASDQFCTGTLVATRSVLTSATCAMQSAPGLPTVRFGVASRSPKAVVGVASVLVHPDYDPVSRARDVAVLHLAGSPPDGTTIHPWLADGDGGELAEGVTFFAVGYGLDARPVPADGQRLQGILETGAIGADSFPGLSLIDDLGHPCGDGDLGAPALDVDSPGTVIGLFRIGNEACTESRFQRVDVEAAFITGALAAPEPVAGAAGVAILTLAVLARSRGRS